MTRLEKIYKEKVVPAMQKEFNYKSPMQMPGITKISLNIGLALPPRTTSSWKRPWRN